MPGIHTIINGNETRPLPDEYDLRESLTEDFFKLDIVTQDALSILAVSYHDGYPFSIWRNDNISIILEGMIYNLSEDYIKTALQKIAVCFAKGDDYKELVETFVDCADGDYIVEIWDSAGKRLLVFNDRLGRLALYYYYRDGLFVLGREIKMLLRFIPKIQFDRSGLVEFLTFEYTLGDKTLIEDIHRLAPSKILEVDSENGHVALKIYDSAEFDFILKDPFRDKETAIDFFTSAFMEAVENRVKTLKSRNFRIISDLSGGYDSRTVLAGLSRFTRDVLYVTFEYIQNEEPWAKAAFLKMGSPGEYYKLSLKDRFDPQDASSIVYKTDVSAGYHVTYVCYRDLQYLKGGIPERACRFTGLGGEFLRHPFKHYEGSIFEGVKNQFYTSVSLEAACEILGLSVNRYREEFEYYLSLWPEKDPAGQLKRLYYQYYEHAVSGGAEDRERIHFWTVPAMWNLHFMRGVFSRLPLEWTGYDFYGRYMKAIDERLLEIPIYGRDISSDLQPDDAQVVVKEAAGQINRFSSLRSVVARHMPTVASLYRYARGSRRVDMELSEEILEILNDYLDKSVFAENIFKPTAVRKNIHGLGGKGITRLVTLLMYMAEVEKRLC